MGAADYDQDFHLAADDVNNGRLEEGLADLDKANVCLSAASVSEKLGRSDDALAWYDGGMAYERHHSRSNVAENKAAYLAGKGRPQESLALYRRLLSESSLMEADKDRIRHNVTLLEERARS